MNKKTLFMSALVLLAMSVSACNLLPDSSSPEGDDSSNAPADTSSSSSSTSSAPAEHTHTWESTWTSDDDTHWHKCRGYVSAGVKCEEKKDEAPHTWDSGTVVTPAGPYKNGLTRYKCNICQRTKEVETPATGGNEDLGNFTFNETALSTPQEIHTSNQKGYLNNITDYYNITTSQLNTYEARGSNNNSTPNKVTVSWDYTAPTGKSVSSYLFVYGQKSDLSDAIQINGTTAKSISFYNAYLGDNYFKVIANLNDGSVEASEIKTFKVDGQAPRNLYVGNLPNCRDMGGRTTYAGGKIKQGMIYRTSGNKFDNRNAPDTEAKQILKETLRMKTELSVADNSGYDVNINGVNLIQAFMDYGKANTNDGIGGNGVPYSNLSRNAEKVRMVLELLANRNNYPVFYHCRIGTDRTGIIAIIVNGLIGVPFQEVLQDYCFSNFAPIGGQRYPGIHRNDTDGNGDDPAKYIDEIINMPGTNFQEKVYNALLSIGVKASTMDSVIDILTEGNKATLPTTMKVGKDNDLRSSGAKQTATDYMHPNTYYPISSGGSVSYTTTTTSGEKDIVVYLGSTTVSNNTKLASCISLKIDGNSQTIVDKTLYKAGFGTTQHLNNTAYMFQILGKYILSAGEHTFTIGCSSNTYNIGTICVFDHTGSTTTL